TDSAPDGSSTSTIHRPDGYSTPAPDSSTRVPRTSSTLIPALSGTSSGTTCPECGVITTTPSPPSVRTAMMRPSGSGWNHLVPSTHGGPPVSASAGATGTGGCPENGFSSRRFHQPEGSP